jgi:hypothetical protein
MSGKPDYGGRRTPLPTATKPRNHYQRIARLGVGALHPACRSAYTEGRTPCGRCSWLLNLDTVEAEYVQAHLDDGEEWA